MKKRGRPRDIVVVDLEEREWVKVLEVPVPRDLIWLAVIKMLHPVQFDRNELGMLVFQIREHVRKVRQPREKRLFDRLADKMADAMSSCSSKAETRRTSSEFVPNDKRVALRTMRRDLREWEKDSGADDPALAEYQAVMESFRTQLLGPTRKRTGKAGNVR